MADHSKIEWCDSTFNPWLGCTKVSAACDHCYAENLMDSRLHRVEWGAGKPRVRTSEANWRKPLQWNKWRFFECPNCHWTGTRKEAIYLPHIGHSHRCPSCFSDPLPERRRRVFCASLADVFDNEVDQAWRDDLFDLIVSTPNLDWLLLTKRIGNVGWMVSSSGVLVQRVLPPNVWLGATICNQTEADRDIPKLLATPAAVRFLSIEPMLGYIDLGSAYTESAFYAAAKADGLEFEHTRPDPDTGAFEPVGEDLLPGIHWVIAGGESGPSARPSHPDWFRSLRDQCAAAGVPFLFKQWGEWLPGTILENANRRGTLILPDGTPMSEVVDEKSTDPTAEVLDLLEVDGPWQHLSMVGKCAAGRLLDGVEHNGFPETH